VDLRRLRHLMAVAEHGNFGRAAAASYITQPALSRSIQALEAEVGAPLFDRRPSGVELTDMGRLLLRHATALDAGARDLDRDIRLAKGLELGELRIGVGPWGGAALVAPVIGRLHSQHPRLRMRIVVAPWRELPARLRSRDVDIVVGAMGEIEHLDEFEILGLAEHAMVVVGRRGHPLTDAPDVTLGDVFQFPLVGPGMDSDAAEVLLGLAGAATDAPTPPAATELLTIECDSSDVLRRILVESEALTFMPRFVVDADLQDGRLAIVSGVDLQLRVRFGAAWNPGRTLGGPGTTFLDLLHAHDENSSDRRDQTLVGENRKTGPSDLPS
jgi:DNA-binding transcriptional LysR family regulator